VRGVFGFVVATSLGLAVAQAATVNILAAENFYGNVAEQIGGPEVDVASILTNPDQDPHLFEVSASTARKIAGAEIVIFNGAGYDPWMVKLLSASPAAGRATIDVARLMHRKSGDNPHLWYDPATMPTLAKALMALLVKRDPAHRAAYAARLARFEASLRPLADEIATLRRTYKGTPVTATEPVFGYMAAALGLEMRNPGFQLAIMNNTEPGASEIAAFQHDLRSRAVRLLLYNVQTSEALTERMKALARQSGVPVVGVSETEPANMNYQAWMMSQLTALGQALSSEQR
jgi:zinc/manganese transport system substrate-binding protein